MSEQSTPFTGQVDVDRILADVDRQLAEDGPDVVEVLTSAHARLQAVLSGPA